MFTGLIQQIGRLEEMKRGGGRTQLRISHEPWETPLEPGESVAVQGICLTVALPAPGGFTCDVLDETLARTSLPEKPVRSPLNLERALRVGDRLGGHYVTGHVEGTGAVKTISLRGEDRVLSVSCEPARAQQIVEKGSIACDGVSLTITSVSGDGFEVKLIPFTWEHTTFASLKEGDAINLETDMLGKYVRQSMADGDRSAARLTMDDLRKAGFL